MWFMLQDDAQADVLATAVNKALSLPEDHDLGARFIADFVFTDDVPRDTTHRAISAWCRQNKFLRGVGTDEPKAFTLLESRYNALAGLLEVFSVMMGKSLIKNFDIPIPSKDVD